MYFQPRILRNNSGCFCRDFWTMCGLINCFSFKFYSGIFQTGKGHPIQRSAIFTLCSLGFIGGIMMGYKSGFNRYFQRKREKVNVYKETISNYHWTDPFPISPFSMCGPDYVDTNCDNGSPAVKLPQNVHI